jgi:hypothetical protein
LSKPIIELASAKSSALPGSATNSRHAASIVLKASRNRIFIAQQLCRQKHKQSRRHSALKE